jgi:hypothetical protein
MVTPRDFRSATRSHTIGVTSMAETGVLLDGHGRPVAPAIAWHALSLVVMDPVRRVGQPLDPIQVGTSSWSGSASSGPG